MKRGLALAILLILVVCIIVFEPYCWDSLLRSQCVDKVYRDGLDMAKEQKPVNVSSGSVVRVELSGNPEQVKLTQWHEQKKKSRIVLKEDQFNAPTEPGVYVYELNSRWKQGDGQFGFSLKVQ